MKRRNIHFLLLIFLLNILAGCIRAYYTPDIVLKDNGQPCISIPRSEDILRTNRLFNITLATVSLPVDGKELSVKNYDNPENQYYVKAQECIDFNYYFKNDFTYQIDFISVEKDQKAKFWEVLIRITKDKDGNLKLLNDNEVNLDDIN